jgi:hypothetical protein
VGDNEIGDDKNVGESLAISIAILLKQPKTLSKHNF